jgi:hypothetical protein
MNQDESSYERRIADAFATDLPAPSSENRVLRVMQRIRVEVAAREVLLFVFVRIWLTALEFGAAMYAKGGPTKRA